MPQDGGPVVDGGGDDTPQGRRSDLEVREFLHGGLDHGLEGVELDGGNVVIHAFDFEAEGCGEIFLVADHDIHVFGDFTVHFLSFGQASDGFPE